MNAVLLFPVPQEAESVSNEGRVSVIIPARNEEANIETAVRSVTAQQDVREIIVVDDQSTDRTPQILEGLKAEIPALEVVHIKTLPAGWMGKNHALATAAKLATGEWLLLTDADTQHFSGSLEVLLDRAEREHVDMLSISPRQEMRSAWEKALIPMVYIWLSGQYRFEDVSDPRSPAAAANGQYILVRRGIYERVGGHAAIRDAVLEDVRLAQHVKSAGGRLLFLPGAAWVQTRMYRSLGEMWLGWTKNLYLLSGRNLRRLLTTVAELGFLDLLPLLAFFGFILLGGLGGQSVRCLLGALGSAVIVAVRHAAYARRLRALGFDRGLSKYRSLGALLFSLLLLNSARVYRHRRTVEWKGRIYSIDD